MGENKNFGPGETGGFPYPMCKKNLSYIPILYHKTNLYSWYNFGRVAICLIA